MKTKLFYFLVSSLLVLSSCSNDIDSNPTVPVRTILPKTLTYKMASYDYSTGTGVITGYNNQTNTFTYNGNKIVSAECSVYNHTMKTVFTYTGSLITKTEGYVDNSLISRVSYVYEKGKLKETALLLPNSNLVNDFYVKNVYTHNADGTISYRTYRHDNPTIPEDGEQILSFKNGNLVKRTTKYLEDNSYYKYTYEYKYDTQNNPLKNILGLDLIMFDMGGIYNGHDMSYGDFGINDFGINNVIEKITYVSDKEKTMKYVETLTYKYDENGYPVEKKSDEAIDDIFYTY
jgi:hypothetical protein